MTESTMDIQKVRMIQFGLLNPKEIVSLPLSGTFELTLSFYSKPCRSCKWIMRNLMRTESPVTEESMISGWAQLTEHSDALHAKEVSYGIWSKGVREV